jgi:hypothetical protein
MLLMLFRIFCTHMVTRFALYVGVSRSLHHYHCDSGAVIWKHPHQHTEQNAQPYGGKNLMVGQWTRNM